LAKRKGINAITGKPLGKAILVHRLNAKSR
jgi:hypothetical protein